MAKTPKDIWIDEAMESATGISRATPPDTLFRKIEQKVSGTVAYARTVPLRTVSLAAASIVLLVVLNVYMLRNTAKHEQKTQVSQVETLVDYYGLNDNGINF